jgi:hypothetical protein
LHPSLIFMGKDGTYLAEATCWTLL